MTQSEYNYLADHFPFEPTADVARALGKSVSAIERCARRFGIIKNRGYLARIRSIAGRKGGIAAHPA